MNNPDISIVVCTHNRAAMLREAVGNLLQLETNARFHYEIVVVDNASSDNTAEVVAELQSSPRAEIRYVYEAKKGIASARNRGVREAAGSWIAFFDDDQLADPHWLARLYAYGQENNIRGVGGPVHLKLPDDCARSLHPFICMLLGESRLGPEPFAYSLKVSPGTGNLMLHRTVFEEIGLFDEQFAVRAEDTDLFCRMWRAGIEAWYVPKALVHHVTPYERLQECYLQRLASFMGRGIATREHETLNFGSFLARFVAKGMLIPALLRTKALLARLRADEETRLGLRMKRQLSSAYRQTGWEILRNDVYRCWPRSGSFQAASQATR